MKLMKMSCIKLGLIFMGCMLITGSADARLHERDDDDGTILPEQILPHTNIPNNTLNSYLANPYADDDNRTVSYDPTVNGMGLYTTSKDQDTINGKNVSTCELLKIKIEDQIKAALDDHNLGVHKANTLKERCERYTLRGQAACRGRDPFFDNPDNSCDRIKAKATLCDPERLYPGDWEADKDKLGANLCKTVYEDLI